MCGPINDPPYRSVIRILLGLVLASGTACTPESSAPRQAVVAVLDHAEDARTTALIHSLRAEARRRDLTLIIETAGERRTQERLLERHAERGCRLLVLQPVEDTGWEPFLDRMARTPARPPLFVVDRPLALAPHPAVRCTIAGDPVEQGRLAARLLLETLDAGPVLELPGSVGSTVRSDGFREIWRAAGHHQAPVRWFAPASLADEPEALARAIQDHLDAAPTTYAAIFAHDASTGLAAARAALRTTRRPTPDSRTLVLCGEAPESVLLDLHRKRFVVAIATDPLLGPAVFDCLAQIEEQGTLPRRVIIPSETIRPDQAVHLLPNRLY